ncbi:MAG: carotenoid oxygenase family protein [Prochloraceae cyanobacterium]
MNGQNQNSNELGKKCCCPVPDSIMNATRCEFTDLKLNIIEGKLPKNLQGYVFIVAPVGTINSGGLPFANGNSFMDGDGMIYRLNFQVRDQVTLKTRLVKTPDYYADKATQSESKYAKYGFRDYGILRFSFYLGSRNFLNTGFLPLQSKQSEQERLLVTYDAGRPYEIDTQTLEIVTPIGANKEWQGATTLKHPFKSVLSTAHPAFDARENEMFTVNYGRSLGNLLETIPLFNELGELPEEANEFLLSLAEILESDFIVDIFQLFSQFSGNVFQEIFQLYVSLIERITSIEIRDFVYLIRWDAQGKLERWRLVLPDGTPVRIEQTIHQIGVTKDYVLLMDTAFKTGLDQVINNPWPKTDGGDRLARDFLTRPIIPDSSIYIVRRRDLQRGQHPACGEREVKVMAQKVVIPMEASHFLVDYDNRDNQITLHVAHICAWEISEWLRTFDLSAYPNNNPVPSRLHSMQLNEMDIGRMGRYVINGETAQVIKSQVIYDYDCTWGVGLYAYSEQSCSGMPPDKFEDIYWSTYGLWKELMTKFAFDLYKNYKYRVVPLEELLDLANQGIPACLFRLNISDKSIAIVDRYKFDCGYMVSSPQFVPSRDGQPSSINGYIVCTVFSQDSNQIWIFDASDLNGGPLCKLTHPSLDFGLTLHTAWLSKIGSRQAEYRIGVRQDYQDTVRRMSKKFPQIEQLFERDVYPQFETFE